MSSPPSTPGARNRAAKALRTLLAWLPFWMGWPAVAPLAGNPAEPMSLFRPDPETVATGRYVFERSCLPCHGPRGNGRGELSAGMIPPPRDFRRGLFKYRSTPSGFLPTDADLSRVIRAGISGTAMPTFQMLRPADLDSVIVYVKSLSPRWTNPSLITRPMSVPPRPGWFQEPNERARHAGKGQRLFLGLCAPCHGPSGAGDGPAAATLEDAWERPSPPSDLRASHLRSGPDPEDLLRTLRNGLDGTPMPSFEESTDEAQRWDLIAFVLSLRRP